MQDGHEVLHPDWAVRDSVAESGAHSLDLGPFLEAMTWARDTYYIPSFRNAVNVGGTDDYFDIRTGEQFVKAWWEYQSGPNKESNRGAVRLIQDIRRIFGFDSFDINPMTDARRLQVVIDDKPYALEEVGSGLAHFILALANVAVRRPQLVLIDEPEMSLHPPLQMDFLTTLASYGQTG